MEQSSRELAARIKLLEQRLRRAQIMFVAILIGGAAALTTACTALSTQRAEASDGIIRARGIVIQDANGVERIYIGAPVPSGPGEAGERIAEATGMIILDENRRERFGLGLMKNGWMNMGFDAAPGVGSGSNRERLLLGVTPDGRGFIRFLDQKSGLAGRLHLTEEDAMAVELWQGQDGRFQRGTLGLNGWQRLPDYVSPGTER